MKKLLQILGTAVALSIAAVNARAEFISAKLDNLASGPFGSYGLRLDNKDGMQTFSFEPGVVMDFNYTPTGVGAAVIHGTVAHNESGQLYDLEVYFKWRAFTNADASDWRSDTSGDLYRTMLLDLIANGNNHSAATFPEIHDPTFDADRLAFNFSRVTLTLQPGQGDPAFVPHYNLSRVPDLYRFYHYTEDADSIPFVIAKGFSLDTDTERLVGHVELDPRGPHATADKHIYQQELLFTLTPLPLPPEDNDPDDWEEDPDNEQPGDPSDTPTNGGGDPANGAAVPEPSTLSLLLLGLVAGAGFFAWRKKNAEQE